MTVEKRTDTPDWNDLRFFVELARCQNLSAAARNLKVSHATVARRIASLEASLGKPLFEPRGGRYALTLDGRRVLSMAEAMEESALAIARMPAVSADKIAGPVRITATDAMGSLMLPPILRRLMQLRPGLRLSVVGTNENLSLERREADIALRVARPSTGNIVMRKLSDIAYYFYACPEYLASVGNGEIGYIGYSGIGLNTPESQNFAAVAPIDRIVYSTTRSSAAFTPSRQVSALACYPVIRVSRRGWCAWRSTSPYCANCGW